MELILIFIVIFGGFLLAHRLGSSSGRSDPSDQPIAPRPRPRPARPRRPPQPTPQPQPQPQPQPRPQPQPQPQQEVLTGKCHVIDGDTIVIRKTHIRLFGIDAPELNHPWGQKAKWDMVKLCKGQDITATLIGANSHDRVVAVCRLPDGTDLSAELVRRGLAIDWPKFSGGVYAQFEQPGIRKKLWRCHNRQTGRFVPD